MEDTSQLEEVVRLLELSREQLQMTPERVRALHDRVAALPEDDRAEALGKGREEITHFINHPWMKALALLPDLDASEIERDGRIQAIMQEAWSFQTEALIWAPVDDRQPTPGDRSRKGDEIPASLAQQTFQEMRNLGIALSDGPSGRRWVDVDGELAMVHHVPDQPLHVRFSPSSMLLAWWPGPPTYARLHTELKEAGAPAVLLAHVAVSLILEQGKVTVSLDDLRHAIGWTRRESDLIQDQLRRVWRMLLLISSMPVIGKRNQTYRDKRTRQVLDLVSEDPLIVVRGLRRPGSSAEETDIPYDVALDGGAWIDQYRGNRGILTDFGDVLQLAKIPAGKPAGAWAQSIGLALNQRWRERSAGAEIATVGEDSHLTVRFRQPFTRRDLLEMFRAEPYYQDVLDSPNPTRARKYWDAAIKLLKDQGVIGHYAEIRPLAAGRQGWQAPWLAQPLDIRPAHDGRQAAIEIARSARLSSAKTTRHRPRKSEAR